MGAWHTPGVRAPVGVLAELLLPESGRNAWLESLIRPHSRPYAERAPLALESMGRLLAAVGNPHERLRCIHIAGSKGKGATALMIEALLEAAGFRTGTYTSPHLERWTERFRIGGQELSEGDLGEALDALKPHVDALAGAHPENPPSFFDVATAAGLWLFARHCVQLAIIESGIGGRFDATNIIRPEVACITNVELEHCDKLGPDLAAIAAHKAGILKPAAAAVLGTFDPAAAAVIRSQAKRTGGPALWLGRDFQIACEPAPRGQRIRYRSGDRALECFLAHPGDHMADNAALALACVERLPEMDAKRLASALSGLENLALPGRTEILRTSPWWIVDAAHTPRSVAALNQALASLPARERHFVVALSGDKPAGLLAPLLESAACVIVTSPEPLRSMPAERLASSVSSFFPRLEVIPEPNVSAALDRILPRLRPASVLCAFGSTYIAGAARRHLLSCAAGEDGNTPATHRPSAPARAPGIRAS